jgi:hypothetical protein
MVGTNLPWDQEKCSAVLPSLPMWAIRTSAFDSFSVK